MTRTSLFRVLCAAAALLALAFAAISADPEERAPAGVNVLTYHNDNARTGLNPRETALTPANVNAAQFGKLFAFPVDGAIYAQPLYLQRVDVPARGPMSLVFVATEHDSVYAFDASLRDPAPVWHTSFLRDGATTVPREEVGSTVWPEIGITSTPVIDPATNMLYVHALTKEDGAYVQRLHALDVATGAERRGSPVVIRASVPGIGEGSRDGVQTFDPRIQLQRAALLLANGRVYLAFASHGDLGDYHGWVLAYDARTLAPAGVWNSTPDGYQGGIWMGGGGLAADSRGRIIGVTGNGKFDGGRNWSNTFFKLSPDLARVEDYFTPFNHQELSRIDADLGSGGALLVPGTPLVIAAGKEGRIYLVDRQRMGRFHADADHIVQSLPRALGDAPDNSSFCSPAWWNGFVYFVGADGDTLKQFRLETRHPKLETASLATGLSGAFLETRNPKLETVLGAPALSPTTYGFHGATPSVSSNGNSDAIVWTIEPATATLRAHDAANVRRELYSSGTQPARDTLGPTPPFAVPTIANGKVFVGTRAALVVYGLLN